ncbi:MAG: hypothetical protein ACREV7_07255 [Steroidobacteraceae bacterium]
MRECRKRRLAALDRQSENAARVELLALVGDRDLVELEGIERPGPFHGANFGPGGLHVLSDESAEHGRAQVPAGLRPSVQ